MSSSTPSIDQVDLSILRVMHEFEYDPCEFRSPRISPVALYLLHGALWPVSEEKPLYEGLPGLRVNLHARAEGLRALGYLRSAEQNWQTFSGRPMRDGRFIAVICHRGVHRLVIDDGEDVLQGVMEFRVCFDHESHFVKAVSEARSEQVGVNDAKIVDAVLEQKFKHLTWRDYDEVAEREWLRRIGHPDAPTGRVNEFGLCYALTPKGIRCVRESADDRGSSSPPRTEDETKRKEKLPPSRVKARAVYEWAEARIDGANDMCLRELHGKILDKLDALIADPRTPVSEVDKWQEFRDSLPDNSETFGKYLRDAGIKRYNSSGDRISRFKRSDES